MKTLKIEKLTPSEKDAILYIYDIVAAINGERGTNLQVINNLFRYCYVSDKFTGIIITSTTAEGLICCELGQDGQAIKFIRYYDRLHFFRELMPENYDNY